MTATNFHDLLNPIEHFKAGDGEWSIRVRSADEILAIPAIDCPTCRGSGVTVTPSSVANAFFAVTAGATLARGAGVPHLTCPACTGTGKATVAQLLAWGSAVAQDLTSDELTSTWNDWDLPFEAVVEYRNRILDTQP